MWRRIWSESTHSRIWSESNHSRIWSESTRSQDSSKPSFELVMKIYVNIRHLLMGFWILMESFLQRCPRFLIFCLKKFLTCAANRKFPTITCYKWLFICYWQRPIKETKFSVYGCRIYTKVMFKKLK